MSIYAASNYKVDGRNADAFSLEQCVTRVDDERASLSDEDKETQLLKECKKLRTQHKTLMADARFGVLLVFQAMDAAGKDSTIKHVFRGLNPSGLNVQSFKQPSAEELRHDFLWRTNQHHPERGRITVFNRSHYEEVLVVRVHPEYLGAQCLPDSVGYSDECQSEFWQSRYESIRANESHLHGSGMLVMKFFLNVSREEQQRRFLARLETESKRWKFSARDLKESMFWDDYMKAYEEMIQTTATDKAPWYVIPADDKLIMRTEVARVVGDTLASLPLTYPDLNADDQQVAQWKDEISKVLKDMK
ncbi:MAG: PPK2 family polyphosphate kinase [Pseudomonadota bacterium]